MYVYVVTEEGYDGPCKIGYSDNPALNLGHMNRGNYRTLILNKELYFGRMARVIEGLVHNKLDALELRIKGEWFDITIDQAVLLIMEYKHYLQEEALFVKSKNVTDSSITKIAKIQKRRLKEKAGLRLIKENAEIAFKKTS